ncbi:MAG: succinate dehydrogenase iron-sulfur subunit [Planctomycetes bacterium]|nr:succinate dehydrogenase iron-sulfur subunit [Planctomycetota bacterium]
MTEFRVFRFDPADNKPARFDTYTVPWEKGMTVLEGLLYISDYFQDSPSFRYSCRAAVCGSCAMHINGKYRLACNTLIETLLKEGNGTITIQPLAHLPVYKDLVVNMDNFFRNYEAIRPYLIPDKSVPENGSAALTTREFIQSPKDRKKIDGAIDCILCGACYGSCPVAGTNPEYLGPHAILKAARFYNDSRDAASKERLSIIGNNHGLFRCHSIFNCQVVCPKNLDPAGAISQMKMKLVWSKVKGLFGLG